MKFAISWKNEHALLVLVGLIISFYRKYQYKQYSKTIFLLTSFIIVFAIVDYSTDFEQIKWWLGTHIFTSIYFCLPFEV